MNTEIDINSKYVSEQEITEAIGGTGNNGAEKIKNAFVTKNQSEDDEGKFLKVDNGRVRCKDVTIPSAYKHPTFTANTNGLNGLYKVTVDAEGHVTDTNAVTGNDLPNIPQTKIDLSGIKLTDLDNSGFTLPYTSITNRPTSLNDFSKENFKINVNNVITNNGTSIKLSNMNQDGFSITNGMIPTKTITLDKLNSSAYTTTLDNSEKLITNKAVNTKVSSLESSFNAHGHGSITNDGQISATTNNVTRVLVTDGNAIKSTTKIPADKVDLSNYSTTSHKHQWRNVTVDTAGNSCEVNYINGVRYAQYVNDTGVSVITLYGELTASSSGTSDEVSIAMVNPNYIPLSESHSDYTGAPASHSFTYGILHNKGNILGRLENNTINNIKKWRVMLINNSSTAKPTINGKVIYVYK